MTSSGSSTKRLLQEWRQVGAQGPGLNVASLGPRSAESLFRWVALVQGPQDSPYAGGLFSIDIQIPPGYPLAPPVMTFTTPVCHPNIHWKTGEICLDVLKSDAWTPAWTLASLCQAILQLLATPEPDSPLNCDAANLLRAKDWRGYASLVRSMTLLYASPSSSSCTVSKKEYAYDNLCKWMDLYFF